MNASLTALQACLEKETRLMSEFLEILQCEAKVLEEGASEAGLLETTASKNTISDQLLDIAGERNVLLKTLGFEQDGSGLAAAAEQYPDLAPVRATLLEATAQARELNEANGSIIEVVLDHNQRTLETLRRLTGQGDIYDASGRTRPGARGSSRNIK